MKNKAVEIRNFTFSYGDDKKIFDDFNFYVDSGEWLALMGRSGRGKSTLISSVCGLSQQVEGANCTGEILIFGKPLQEYSRSELSSTVGVVFQTAQNRIVAPTVEEEIWFGLQNLCIEKQEIIARTDRVLAELGIESIKKINPSRLSGGQQQMVSFAAVVAMAPKIYFFDEVMSQLDEEKRSVALEKIRELHRDGAGIVMVEHSSATSANAQRRVVLEGTNDRS